MSTKSDLKNILKLISDPKHWTQKVAARNKYGKPVESLDTKACKWCIIGSVYKVTGDNGNGSNVMDALHYASATLGYAGKLISVNDGSFAGELKPTTSRLQAHKNALKIVRQAIKLCG